MVAHIHGDVDDPAYLIPAQRDEHIRTFAKTHVAVRRLNS